MARSGRARGLVRWLGAAANAAILSAWVLSLWWDLSWWWQTGNMLRVFGGGNGVLLYTRMTWLSSAR